jgi:L-cysteine S-thiosulfotransferase
MRITDEQAKWTKPTKPTKATPWALALVMSVLVSMSLLVAVLAVPRAKAQAQTQTQIRAPIDTEMTAAARPYKRYADWPQRDESAFDTLAKEGVSPKPPNAPRTVALPLKGDADNGRKLVADRSRGGSCLACHVMGQAGNADLPGNVGPDLSEIGNAARNELWLFNYVYDPRVYNPDSVMPPWGTNGLFNDQEISDIVAFLKTLTKPAVFKNELDDPAKRPAPVEKRANLDALENPAMWAIDKAPSLWALAGPNGSSCATCHRASERFKTWAASMPRFDQRLNRVLGVEEFITRHAKATTGHVWLMESDENIALAVYLRFLANGTPINVDVTSPAAKAAFDRGKALAARRVGQLNFSCNDCHGVSANHWIRGQWLAQQRGQLDHFPTWRTSLLTTWDIRKRLQWCQVNIRGDELPADAPEYGDLELYLTSLSAGLPLNVPGIRH